MVETPARKSKGAMYKDEFETHHKSIQKACKTSTADWAPGSSAYCQDAVEVAFSAREMLCKRRRIGEVKGLQLCSNTAFLIPWDYSDVPSWTGQVQGSNL